MNKVVVVDYGIGNVFSVCNSLKSIGYEPVLSGDRHVIKNADRIILPGVGAFAKAMEALEAADLCEPLGEFIASERPFLGICIGMQLLMDESLEFGTTKGLGYIPGKVVKITDKTSNGQLLRVPHISWATLRRPLEDREDSWNDSVFDGVKDDEQAVYYVHSFHAQCSNPDHVLAESVYGGNRITAAIQKDNIIGFQFHPERSGPTGQRILRSFLSL